MNPLFTAVTLALIVAQFVLPRRFAFLPLLVAICHLPNISVLGIGGGNFPVTRLLIGVGLISAVLQKSLHWNPTHAVDRLMAVFGIAAVLTSFAHENGDDGNPLVFSLGLIYSFVGAYLCGRAFVSDFRHLMLFAKTLTIVLVPLALLMTVQKLSGQNPYAIIGGGIDAESIIRDGRIRAQGPFAHPILAGTAGASLLPLTLILWAEHRKWAVVGAGSCLLITFCSNSSGPVSTVMFAIFALGLWHWRTKLSWIRRGGLVLLLGLHLVMKAPVWYLMARIDLTGSSTGWHRAELITSGLTYLGEWWLAGTDHTRHWMPTGVSWSPNHTDITNHYLQMGVIGGLPLLLAFIAILTKSFQLLGKAMGELRLRGDPSEFKLWCFAAMLFAHSVTFLSVSYFDQTSVLFCFVLGMLVQLCHRSAVSDSYEDEPVAANALPLDHESPDEIRH